MFAHLTCASKAKQERLLVYSTMFSQYGIITIGLTCIATASFIDHALALIGQHNCG